MAHLALVAYLTQALIARTDLLMSAVLARHESLSQQTNDDSILHTRHLLCIVSHRNMNNTQADVKGEK